MPTVTAVFSFRIFGFYGSKIQQFFNNRHPARLFLAVEPSGQPGVDRYALADARPPALINRPDEPERGLVYAGRGLTGACKRCMRPQGIGSHPPAGSGGSYGLRVRGTIVVRRLPFVIGGRRGRASSLTGSLPQGPLKTTRSKQGLRRMAGDRNKPVCGGVVPESRFSKAPYPGIPFRENAYGRRPDGWRSKTAAG